MNDAPPSDAARPARTAALDHPPGAGAAAPSWRTLDDITFDALYPASPPADDLLGRQAGGWRVASRVDHPDPAEASRLARLDVEGGVDTLVLVATDAPSARGFGIDWRNGDQLSTILAGVDLGGVALRFDTGPACRALAAAVRRLCDGGLSPDSLDVDLGFESAASALAPHGGAPDLGGWQSDAVEETRRLLEQGFAGRIWRADGRPWSEAGASEAQEMAAVLASGVQTLRAFEAAGVPLDLARRKLSFLMVADTDVVLTVAKCRALRRLWARVEESCGLRPEPISLHAETSWRTTTASGAHSNILRASVATFAASIGGADGITVLPFTAAVGLPDVAARRLARNTQHVLAEEAHLGRVVDPVAGAGLFEVVTRSLCERAWALFQDIEAEGGLLASIAAGRIQGRVAAVRDERAARLNDGRDALVGTSHYRIEGDLPFVLAAMPTLPWPEPASRLPSVPAERLFEAGRVP